MVSKTDLNELGQIKFQTKLLNLIKETEWSKLENLKIVDKSSPVDLLSLTVWSMRTPIPGWSGVI